MVNHDRSRPRPPTHQFRSGARQAVLSRRRRSVSAQLAEELERARFNAGFALERVHRSLGEPFQPAFGSVARNGRTKQGHNRGSTLVATLRHSPVCPSRPGMTSTPVVTFASGPEVDTGISVCVEA
jgi:hypothetical protein